MQSIPVGPEIQITLAYLSAHWFRSLCFKVAVAPFHLDAGRVWGAVSADGIHVCGTKGCRLCGVVSNFLTAFPHQARWVDGIWSNCANCDSGNASSRLLQPNIKRMLAYSSIAYAAGWQSRLRLPAYWHSAALFYLLAYSVMNLGAFTIITVMSRSEDKLVKIAAADYANRGLWNGALDWQLLSLFLLHWQESRHRRFLRKILYFRIGG
jgi:NADH-quinone oxidoreductase subunit N